MWPLVPYLETLLVENFPPVMMRLLLALSEIEQASLDNNNIYNLHCVYYYYIVWYFNLKPGTLSSPFLTISVVLEYGTRPPMIIVPSSVTQLTCWNLFSSRVWLVTHSPEEEKVMQLVLLMVSYSPPPHSCRPALVWAALSSGSKSSLQLSCWVE